MPDPAAAADRGREPGSDSEIASAASGVSPEQILQVRVGIVPAGGHDLRPPFCRHMHQLDRIEIVDRQPMQSRQQSIPATGYMSPRTHRRARPGGNRYPELLRQRRIDIQYSSARLERVPAIRYLPHLRHRRKIDDDPTIVTAGEVLVTMPATPHRDPQPLVDRFLHCRGHLPGIAAQRDIRRRPHPSLIEPPGIPSIVWVAGEHQLSGATARSWSALVGVAQKAIATRGERSADRATHRQKTPPVRGECHSLYPLPLTRRQKRHLGICV
jgi:hypothetical protein